MRSVLERWETFKRTSSPVGATQEKADRRRCGERQCPVAPRANIITNLLRTRTNTLALLLTAVAFVSSAAPAQNCFKIRGRAVLYRGDWFFEIWHVGSHHLFFPANKQSADLMCQYFDCKSADRQPALFADFTVCPTKPYKRGAAQPVIVKRVEHQRVVKKWRGHRG